MANNKLGKQTFCFANAPEVIGGAAIGGQMEGQGPLAKWFDVLLEDDMYNEKTWEKAESKMLRTAVLLALKDAGRNEKQLDVLLSGDLLNQIMSSSFMARDLGAPFLGLYGACSAMTESLTLGAVLVDGGYADLVAASASSHYCTAERQFRMPLGHGNQRPLSAQWTATAAGSMIVSSQPRGGQRIVEGRPGRRIFITHATVGKIVDSGIKDSHQMWAAMAPAAADTIHTHLEDTGRKPEDYSLIITGDMGFVGKKVVKDLLRKRGILVEGRYDDCGAMLYHEEQDVHGGGSGCGCSAAVFSGRIFREIQAGALNRVLLVSTGALMTTVSSQQGESIPGIAHGVVVEGRDEPWSM